MPTSDTAVDKATTPDSSALAAITDTLNFDPSSPDLNDEPQTWEEAQRSPYAKQWHTGYKEELTSLKDMGVCELVPRSQVPPGQKIQKG